MPLKKKIKVSHKEEEPVVEQRVSEDAKNDEVIDNEKNSDPNLLDLVFLMDCTGSMGSYIESAEESIRQVVEEIVAQQKSDIRLSLVEYRDHPPQDTTFVTLSHDFTHSIKKMKRWLEKCEAVGGGDEPEAVADGLNEVLKLSWREKSTKICVLIADAPPHGLGARGDSFPSGCPLGIDPLQVVKEMARKGITLYSVGCEPAITPYRDFFSAIAFATGGQYVPLRNAKLLSTVIVGGALEEMSLEKLMKQVQVEVQEQVDKGNTDQVLLTEFVQKRLRSKGTTSYQMKLNNGELEKVSECVKSYSSLESMDMLRSVYKPVWSGSRVSSGSRGGRGGRGWKGTSGGRGGSSSRGFTVSFEHDGSSMPELAQEQPYTVAEDTIQIGQVERMVKKALNRTSK